MPKITPESINELIFEEHYFSPVDALNTHGYYPAKDDRLHLMTICVLKLRNGFLVTGESCCVDAAHYDENIGREVARKNAVDKIWPLLGYLLREAIYYQEANADRSPQILG